LNIGDKIKELRKNKGLTQSELAKIVGKSTITIRKYESGDITPPIDVLNDIAESLNVQIEYILGKSEYKKFDSDIIKNDIFELIKITDDKDNAFSKLVRNIMDISFLTIYDFSKDENTEVLKIIYSLYRNIWKIKNICQSKKLFKILELPEFDEDIETFEDLKNNNIILLEKLCETLSNENK